MRILLSYFLAWLLCLNPVLAQGGTGSTVAPQPGYLSGSLMPIPPGSTTRTSIISGNGFNIFAPNVAPVFTLYPKGGTSGYTTVGANTAIVYDINGNVVANVPITTPGAGSYSLTLPAFAKNGWYYLVLLGPPPVDSIFGNVFGYACFNVCPADSNFVVGPYVQYTDSRNYWPNGDAGLLSTNNAQPGAHGVFDAGPCRFGIAEGTGSQATQVAAAQAAATAIQQNIAWDATYGWTAMTPDSARPKIHQVCFQDFGGFGFEPQHTIDIACVTAAVAILGTSVVWSGFNEPNNIGYTPSQYVPFQNDFYTAVKAGNASALVVGPEILAPNAAYISWVQGFLSNSPAPKFDIFSFHPYNTIVGSDMWVGDQSMTAVKAALVANGFGLAPLWDSEVGQNNSNDYNPFMARRHLKECISQTLQHEAYGVPKESQVYFQDGINGFQTVPRMGSQIFNLNGVNYLYTQDCYPTMLAGRILSEQLRGTSVPPTSLSFSSAGDFLKGYQYSKSGGGYVTALFTVASSSLPITISGASSAVDVWGNTITLTANYPLSDLPIYVSSASPLTISDVGNGLMAATNIAPSGTATVAGGMDTTNVAKINDGLLCSSYYYSDASIDKSYSPYSDGNNIMPATATITWGSSKSIDRLAVFSGRPWQLYSAATVFQLQYYNGSTWVTIPGTTYTNPTAYSLPIGTQSNESAYTVLYNGEWIVHFKLASPITTTAVRIVQTGSSYGNCPDFQSFNCNTSFPQGTVQRMSLNDFRAYSN